MSRKRISRRSTLKLIGAGSLGIGMTGLSGYLYAFHIEPHWLSIERISIPFPDLPEAFAGFKIVCMSDFHHEPEDGLGYLHRVVQSANDLTPDAVCLLGDYVFSEAHSIDALASALSNLEAHHGVYAILGNHDYWTDADLVRAGLERAGIKVLINQAAPLKLGAEALYLVGLDDGWSGKPDPAAALKSVPADAPAIVMIHEPDFADRIAAHQQVGLQLSGHSHGGQVKPLYFEAPMRPAYARKYSAGLYSVGPMILYVTRGIGVIPPRVRFNCRPEITEVVLTPTRV